MPEKHSLDCSLETKEICDNVDDQTLELQESLDKVIKNEGYIEYTVKKYNFSTGGGNFLGILTEIDVSGKTEHGVQNTNIFVKQIIPENDFAFTSISNCYHNEAFAYKKLLKMYKELQDKAKVPAKERYNAVRSFNETNEKAIILENLSRKGFKTIERMKVITIEYAELCIKQLAKLHGLSIEIQNENPEDFCNLLEELKVSTYFYDNGFLRFAKNMFNVAYMYLSDETGDKIKEYTEKYIERLKTHLDTTTVGCCICHGDFRANNVMYKEQDGVIQEVVVIDFQHLHYGRPINDFMTFIFLETDRDFRNRHLEFLKNLYYETLEKFLIYFNLDVNQLYPKEDYEVHFKSGLEYGLIRSLYTLPMLFIEEKDIPDLGKLKKLREVPFTVQSQYIERIQGIVDDCIQWNIL